MARGNIALVREQGVEFAVVCVADRVVEGSIEREGGAIERGLVNLGVR